MFEKSSEQKSRKRGAEESDAPSCSTSSSMAVLPQLYEKAPRADSVAAKIFTLAQKKAIASLSDDVLDVR